MKTTIDVLLPVYNCENYIEKTIKSILNQTFKNFNLIIVNDGSTDNSFAICKKYQEQDKRIRLFQKENEKSVSKTRNYLLSKITSPYFVFVDSDDLVSPLFLEILLKAIKENKCDIACCGYTYVENIYTPFKKVLFPHVFKSQDAIGEFILKGNGHYMLWNKLIKSKLVKNIRFQPDMHFGEDLIFVCDLVFNNKCKIVSFHNKLYFYRVLNLTSISKGGLTQSKIDFLDRLINFEQESRYKDNTIVFTVWIYLTALSYQLLTAGNPNYEEYRTKLKQIKKERRKAHNDYMTIEKKIALITHFL